MDYFTEKKEFPRNEYGYYCYQSLDNFNSPMKFYDNKDLPDYQKNTVTYDGYTYHIVLSESYFNICLKGNHNALEELAVNLKRMNGLGVNFKRILRVILFMIILAVPFAVLSKLLIYDLPFVEQKSIVDTLYFLVFVYTFGHLIRIFFANRYKRSTYTNVLSSITDQQYLQKLMDEGYARNHYISKSMNPLKGVWAKNFFKVGMLGFLLYGFAFFATHTTNQEFINPTQQRSYEQVINVLFPVELTTTYELVDTEIVEYVVDGTIHGMGDYILEREKNTTYSEDEYFIIRTQDLEPLFYTKTRISSDVLYHDVLAIKDDYVLIRKHSELLVSGSYEHVEEYAMFDIQTNNQVIDINYVKQLQTGYDYFRVINFTVDGDDIYVLAETVKYEANQSGKNYYYKVYKVENNNLVDVKTMSSENEFRDIIVYNDMFYFTLYEGDNYTTTYIAKGSMDGNDLSVSSQRLVEAEHLYIYQGELYARDWSLYKINDNFFAELYGQEIFYNDSMSKDSILIFGSHPTNMEILDTDGELLAQGLPAPDDMDSWFVAYMRDQEVEIVTTEKIYTFADTGNETTYYAPLPDTNDFIDEFNINLEVLKTNLWIGVSIIVSFPYIRTINILRKKGKQSNLYRNDMY